MEVTYLNGVTREEWAASSKGQAFMQRAEMRHEEEERSRESAYGEQFTHAQAVYGVNKAGL